MSLEFKKFLIKKSSVWGTGNFKVFDFNSELIYLTKSSIWQFKKKTYMLNADGQLIYTIEQIKSWPLKFMIYSDDTLVASFEKKNPFQGRQIDVIIPGFDDLYIEFNIWGNSFTFISNGVEIAMLSYDMWSLGEFGLAMKDLYPQELILAIVSTIGYLKESGQL
jgi:uncharacterized protein YxjI